MRYIIVLSIILAVLGAGCSPKVVQPTISGPETPKKVTGPADEAIKRGDSAYEEGKIKEEELAKREAMEGRSLYESSTTLPLKDIFFDYDSYLIRPEHIPTLNGIARWLKENDVKIIVEGHCDERGTVEYNLVLGQKRAESVKSYLVKAGIDEKRIKTISYGKEMPIDPGHDEAAWAKNRRAHFELTK